MDSKNQGVQTSDARKHDKITSQNIINKLPSASTRQGDMIYFRNKMMQYEAEQKKFKEKLEKYMKIAEDRNELEAELLNKRDKILALQNALSEMQKCLFDERRRSNKLQGEVDIMKLQDEENHRKVRSLLAMTSDKKLRDEIIYIFDKPMGLQIGQRLLNTHSRSDEQTEAKHVDGEQDPQKLIDTSQKQNETIEELVQRQTSLERQRIEALVKDCTISMKEAEKQNKENSEKLKVYIEKLRQVELDLKETNAELLGARKALRREEILRGTQKSVLLKNIQDAVKNVSEYDSVNSVVDKIVRHIDQAFEKFDSTDVSMANQKPPTQVTSTEDSVEESSSSHDVKINIFPKKVSSNVKFSDELSKNVNSRGRSVNPSASHNTSTGQFIQFQNKKGPFYTGSHKPISAKYPLNRYLSKSSSSKENVPIRTTSAPFQHHNKNLKTAKKTSSTQTTTVRPKTADPRRRQKPIDEGHKISEMFKNSNPFNENKDNETVPTRSNSSRTVPSGQSYNDLLEFVRKDVKKKKPFSFETLKSSSHETKPSSKITSDSHDATEKEYTIPKPRGGLYDSHLCQPSDFNKNYAHLPHTSEFSQQTTPKYVNEQKAQDVIVNSRKTCEEKIEDLQDVVTFLNTELQELHDQCLQQEQSSQEYLNHCAKIEQELKDSKFMKFKTPQRMKEYQEWLEKELETTRYKLTKLESYRHLEMEGFQTEIKQLTKKVQDMEKQLFKTLMMIDRGEKDVKLLNKIHDTSKNSLRVSNEVQQLKAKLYQIQNDLRLL